MITTHRDRRSLVMIGPRSRLYGPTAAAAAALVVLAPLPAWADDESADNIAEQAAEVAPPIGATEPASMHTDGAVAHGDVITLEAPLDLDEGITGPGEATALVVTVDVGDETAMAEVASDGSVVYASDAAEDVVVHATDDAVRIQTVIGSAAELHEIPYAFHDGFVPTSDGTTFFAIDAEQPSGAAVYSIDEPWAFDASGAAVETHLEMRGDELVQIVTPDASTTYPIIADPTFRWVSAGFGVQFTRTETRDIANQGGISGACAAITRKIPVGPHKIAGSIACAAIAGYVFSQANVARGANSCIFLQLAPVPAVWRGCS
ncbi:MULTISPECIES: hypothetical protein [unclassified Agrococcus]|uniref:hypothetical protein n=1 Tax=unclassified Agrococcus TaxID=2615065 RepID=UPI003606F18E